MRTQLLPLENSRKDNVLEYFIFNVLLFIFNILPQETLFCMIDILSSMKINQLQLYMQNTFAFSGHETVWRNTTPYSPRYDNIGSFESRK